MYKDSFVVSLKSQGKILREERGGTLQIPFGTQYSIFMKNLESRKALASITIDGVDALDGEKIIVGANSSAEISGFIKDKVAKNNFKFIERTKRIEDFRGINAQDGIIEVRFQFEEKKNYTITISSQPDWTYIPPRKYVYPEFYDPYIYVGKFYGTSDGTLNLTNSKSSAQNCSMDNINCFYSTLDSFEEKKEGITVRGSEIHQQFYNGYIDDLESEIHTIVLKLVGYNNGVEVCKPIYTSEKIQCLTCGKFNSSSSKFCSECGTFLIKN
jgi:hypothetical protein